RPTTRVPAAGATPVCPVPSRRAPTAARTRCASRASSPAADSPRASTGSSCGPSTPRATRRSSSASASASAPDLASPVELALAGPLLVERRREPGDPLLGGVQPRPAGPVELLAAFPQRQGLVERRAAVLERLHDPLELVARLLEGELVRRTRRRR